MGNREMNNRVRWHQRRRGALLALAHVVSLKVGEVGTRLPVASRYGRTVLLLALLALVVMTQSGCALLKAIG